MTDLLIGDHTFRIEVDGDATKPALLLVHSLGSDLSQWDAQMPALLKSFRIIRYDSRGHGGSTLVGSPYSIAMLGRDALGILDALEIETAHVVGVSMGGAVAQWLLTHAPSRVSRAVLANTTARFGATESWNSRIVEVLGHGMSGLADGTMARWFGAAFAAREHQQVGALRAIFEATAPEGYAGCCAAIRDFDLREALRAVTAPVLVIGGRDDPSIGEADIAHLVATIPGAKRVVLEARHISNIEAEAAFTKAVVAFLTASLPVKKAPASTKPAPVAAKAIVARRVGTRRSTAARIPLTAAPTSATASKAPTRKSPVKTVAATASKKTTTTKTTAPKTATPPARKTPAAPAPAKRAASKPAAKATPVPAKTKATKVAAKPAPAKKVAAKPAAKVAKPKSAILPYAKRPSAKNLRAMAAGQTAAKVSKEKVAKAKVTKGKTSKPSASKMPAKTAAPSRKGLAPKVTTRAAKAPTPNKAKIAVKVAKAKAPAIKPKTAPKPPIKAVVRKAPTKSVGSKSASRKTAPKPVAKPLAKSGRRVS